MAKRDEEHIGKILAKFRRENGIRNRQIVAERMAALGEPAASGTLQTYLYRLENMGYAKLKTSWAKTDSVTRLRNYLSALDLTDEQIEYLRTQKIPGGGHIREILNDYQPYSLRE